MKRGPPDAGRERQPPDARDKRYRAPLARVGEKMLAAWKYVTVVCTVVAAAITPLTDPARAETAGSRHGHGIGGAAEGADRGGLAEAAPGASIVLRACRDRLAARGLPAVGFTLPSSIRIARPLARDRAEERKTPGPEGLHALPGRAGLIFRVGQGDLGECGAWATPDGLGNARARPRRLNRLPTL